MLIQNVVKPSLPQLSGRVLLVEDNKTNQKIAQAILKKLGLACDVADDGQQALDVLFAGTEYGLILMDLYMPVMDGIEATREIRQWEKQQGVEAHPIIAITAASPESIKQAMSVGVDHYLPKPINVGELKKLLVRYLH